VLVRKKEPASSHHITRPNTPSPPHLIPKKTERNLEEFAAENYNWRSVCPEEHMHLCTDTQDLIHPVHLELGRYTFGTGGRVARNLHCS
jgi:hypothetical protein